MDARGGVDYGAMARDVASRVERLGGPSPDVPRLAEALRTFCAGGVQKPDLNDAERCAYAEWIVAHPNAPETDPDLSDLHRRINDAWDMA